MKGGRRRRGGGGGGREEERRGGRRKKGAHIIYVQTICKVHIMYLASFPGRVGGEKTAWYPLLAHARAFQEKPGNSFSFVNGQ